MISKKCNMVAMDNRRGKQMMLYCTSFSLYSLAHMESIFSSCESLINLKLLRFGKYISFCPNQNQYTKLGYGGQLSGGYYSYGYLLHSTPTIYSWPPCKTLAASPLGI